MTMKTLTKQQRDMAYQLMLNVLKEGLPVTFKTDLTTHDRQTLYTNNPSEPLCGFGWVAHEYGTCFVDFGCMRSTMEAYTHHIKLNSDVPSRYFTYNGSRWTEYKDAINWSEAMWRYKSHYLETQPQQSQRQSVKPVRKQSMNI